MSTTDPVGGERVAAWANSRAGTPKGWPTVDRRRVRATKAAHAGTGPRHGLVDRAHAGAGNRS